MPPSTALFGWHHFKALWVFDPRDIPDSLSLSYSPAPPFSSNSCIDTFLLSLLLISLHPSRLSPSTHQLLREAFGGRVKHKMGTGRVSTTSKHL